MPRPTSLRSIAVLLALGLAVLPRPARADRLDDATLAGRRALVVLRILAYDKALAKRAPGDKVVVLIVAAPTKLGRAEQAVWQAGFAMLPKVKAGGRAVRAMTVEYDAGTFDAVVAAQRPAAMIVTTGLATTHAELRRIARARRVLTVTVREAEVRAGFAIGLIAAEARDEIAINLEASRAEGARFGAGLLQLARLVEADEP